MQSRVRLSKEMRNEITSFQHTWQCDNQMLQESVLHMHLGTYIGLGKFFFFVFFVCVDKCTERWTVVHAKGTGPVGAEISINVFGQLKSCFILISIL